MVEHWGFGPSLRCLYCYGKDAGGGVKKLSYGCFFDLIVCVFGCHLLYYFQGPEWEKKHRRGRHTLVIHTTEPIY